MVVYSLYFLSRFAFALGFVVIHNFTVLLHFTGPFAENDLGLSLFDSQALGLFGMKAHGPHISEVPIGMGSILRHILDEPYHSLITMRVKRTLAIDTDLRQRGMVRFVKEVMRDEFLHRVLEIRNKSHPIIKLDQKRLRIYRRPSALDFLLHLTVGCLSFFTLGRFDDVIVHEIDLPQILLLKSEFKVFVYELKYVRHLMSAYFGSFE